MALVKPENIPVRGRNHKSQIFSRISGFFAACMIAFVGFYASLVFSADPLKPDEQEMVESAIAELERAGFDDEVFLLRNLTVFRSNDNWLNASVEKENAYAATNFPFEIMTLYPDFFSMPHDDVERAAILLHESRHLRGDGEKDAYEFVWRMRRRLGWTDEKYRGSVIWQNVRRQTAEYSPSLFVCDFNEFNDCTH